MSLRTTNLRESIMAQVEHRIAKVDHWRTRRPVGRQYAYDARGAGVGGTDHAVFNGADRARWKGALWAGLEVELYYLRNRWYEPLSGRFLTQDPIGRAGGVNLYAHAGNDPIGFSDPFGLCASGGPDSVQVQVTVIFPTARQRSRPCGLTAAVGNDTRSSETLATQARINSGATVAELYCHVVGRYPASLDEMRSFSSARHDAPQCVFHDDFRVHAWSRPVRYGLTAGVPAIVSDGPDRITGTTDDVGLPSAQERRSQPIDISSCQ